MKKFYDVAIWAKMETFDQVEADSKDEAVKVALDNMQMEGYFLRGEPSIHVEESEPE